jgi:methylisocitrate lyase
VHTLDDYRAFSNGINGSHLLANITEFGATPLFNKKELGEAGATMVLYPLSAFRAANKAALNVYEHLLNDGDQKAVVDTMQTRMELYDFLNYHDFEQKLDALFKEGKNK